MISRILIVGLGSIGKRHKELVHQLFPNAEIEVLRLRRKSQMADSDSEFLTTIQDAKEFSPEIAVLCTPSTSHISLALDLAKSDAHLLIEKPISQSSAGVLELLEECASRNVVLMVGYNLRYLKSLQEFRRHVSEGLIGKPLSVRCEVGQYLPNWRPKMDYRECVSAKRELGGGVLLELSHEIDYLRWIFGEVDWVRATLLRQSDLEIDVEDTAHLTIGFEKDIFGKQLIANLNMDFIRHDTSRSCTVIGDRGSLRWDGILGEVSVIQADKKAWETLFVNDNGIEETYILEWQEFIKAIKEKRDPAVTGADGLRVVEIIEAALLSSKSGIQTAVIRSPIKSEASR
jgi:predicted dehydrogenase